MAREEAVRPEEMLRLRDLLDPLRRSRREPERQHLLRHEPSLGVAAPEESSSTGDTEKVKNAGRIQVTGAEIIVALRALADSMERERPDHELLGRLLPALLEWKLNASSHHGGEDILRNLGKLLQDI